MKPNKFSKLTQQSLTLVGQIVLIVIAVSTIFAVLQEITHIWKAGSNGILKFTILWSNCGKSVKNVLKNLLPQDSK